MKFLNRQISSVVQSNVAAAETSAVSEELSGQAAMLNDLASKFRLKKETKRGRPAPKQGTDRPLLSARQGIDSAAQTR